MKTSRFICLISVSSLVLTLTVVSPAAASKSSARPLMQSGPIITGDGEFCGAFFGVGDSFCIPWSMQLDPTSGNMQLACKDALENDYNHGKGNGYFEGGDGGAVSGTLSGNCSMFAGGGLLFVEFTSFIWKGQLHADGTGDGTFSAKIGGSEPAVSSGTWTITFGTQAFQVPSTTPSPTPPPGNWDLAIDKIVVLQAVEGGKLVAGKPGAARVFLIWPDPSTNVYVTVDFWVDGKKIASQPANPMIIGNAKKYTQADLRTLKNTANFYIDASYFTPGEHIFSASVRLNPLQQGPQGIQDPNLNNNMQELKLPVQKTRGLSIVFAAGHPDITEQDILDYIARARPFFLDVYPVPNLYFWINPKVVGASWSPNLDVVTNLEYLIRTQSLGKNRYKVADYAVGVVPSGSLGISFLGYGIYGANHWSARQSVLVTTDGPESLTHEIGHDLLGGTEEASKDNCGIYLHGATIYHGQERYLEDVDVRRDRPDPADMRPFINFMGSADACNTWVNRDTWNRLVKWLAAPQAGSAKSGLSAPISQGESYSSGFLVGGTIVTDGAVTITTKFPLEDIKTSAPDSSQESEYRLVALDRVGNLLSWVPLHIDLAEGTPYPFLAALPAPAETSSLAILHNDQRLFTLSRSSNPPTVNIDDPDPAAMKSGIAQITWQASDPDGDAMTFNLSFSRDDGQTWQVIATDLTQQQVQITTSDLPGCDHCRLQVLASDGWNISAATTQKAFQLPDRPPLISVSYPSEGATVDAAQPITLLAVGYDPEDGLLIGDSLSWSSDVDGKLGNGERLELATLSRGTHKITVVARDSTGAETRKTLTINVTGASAPAPVPDNRTIVRVLLGLGGLGTLVLVGVFFIGVIVLFARRQPARRAPTSHPESTSRKPPPPERLGATKGSQKPPPPEKLR